MYGDQETTRCVKTVRGAKTLLKTVHLADLLIKEHLQNNRGSTLREIYYISENWDMAKFHEQAESDRLIEDLEIVTGLHREDFHVRPEEDGAAVFGPLRLKEQTRRGEREMHCQEDVGEAGYQIPFNVDNIEFLSHDAKMVMAIETGGMYARLIENGFDEEYDAILVHIKGQPARSTRRMIKEAEYGAEHPCGGLHRWRSLVLSHLRQHRLRGHQERSPLRAPGHSRGARSWGCSPATSWTTTSPQTS